MKIPFLSTPDKPLYSSTQDKIPIAEIIHDIVLFKDGGAALIIESTSLNFGLLNELEQDAVIASYAGLLNSFNFPVQIVVRSQRKDITNYLRFLEEAKKKIKNPKLMVLLNDYQKFITESVKKKNVLSKNFYLVVPFSKYELGIAKSAISFSKKASFIPFPKSYVLKKARVALYPKRDHLIRQARRLGVDLRQLTTPELIELFYHIYNPQVPGRKRETRF
ncbi:hypothetical protein A3A76_02185 [Candidatus Woesebacteria bacterium RIFCSPLOWO2_01_FULL_39_23]|uniref:Uncharacterized protein n=1 Tax=Candidatus Woesebacteria bacterium RIFCSPHIGHO2_01_FULL_40_22 TaxID=1802499 RepID=A0A1F7YH73_9BACT|nr:MAG: hypothetical protein A2141_03340 [Candidatus Woesebacteria bacterium RBG_16_40_11]OGM26209.1 MAG: hypothetical protein A2628_02620 [Candidatus Woesebacteria bacterium RIFCSPHIGHO2_01_FULL_40_22]OGM36222.1 MAG: hypothetical protein A3E41_02015 [Candidatus Woesebacteria bacterium RIFCSPHIGHO2_12_FULL_38_9]OGM62367.1 MAG: hypothetical protein A3A76_02185 [Candidatus Woesebacteria bacterium RIFCSPLOWO2_01_FULL_39_23]